MLPTWHKLIRLRGSCSDLSSPRVDPSLDPSGCCWQVAEEGATPHGRREGSSDEKLSFVSPGPCYRTCILKSIPCAARTATTTQRFLTAGNGWACAALVMEKLGAPQSSGASGLRYLRTVSPGPASSEAIRHAPKRESWAHATQAQDTLHELAATERRGAT